METMDCFQAPPKDVRGVMVSGKRKAIPTTTKAGPSATPPSSAAGQSTKVASTGKTPTASRPSSSQAAQTSLLPRLKASTSAHPSSSNSSSRTGGWGQMSPSVTRKATAAVAVRLEKAHGSATGGMGKRALSRGGKRDVKVERDTDGPKKKGSLTPSAFPLAPPDPELYKTPSWTIESSQESAISSRRQSRAENPSKRKKTKAAAVKQQDPRPPRRPASPDELNLTDDSRDPSLSSSPGPSSSKARTVVREPLRSSPDKANRPEVKVPSSSQATKTSQKAVKRSRREYSSPSSLGEESDRTPRRTKPEDVSKDRHGTRAIGSRAKTGSQAGSERGTQPKSQGTKRVKRVVESEEESAASEPEGVGAAFFRQLKGMSQRERNHEWGRHEEESDLGEQLLIASQDLPCSPPSIATGNLASGYHAHGLSAGDLEYLQDFVVPDDPCQRTRYLQDQETELGRIKWSVYDDGDLPWSLTINFCETHRAEARIIPLGRREGFPADIDFAAIPSRLEDAAFRTDMDELMASPEDSSLFRRIVKRISSIGRGAWKKLVKQGEKKSLDLAMVGYYGYIGRQIISYHYETLLGQGLLPALDVSGEGPSPVAPLTPREFVEHVLVPEAAIRLIMADLGWQGHGGAESREWSAARTKAYDIWKASTEYGKWKFRGEGPEEKQLLEDAKADMRARLDEWREARERDAKRKRRRRSSHSPRKPIEVIDIELVSSQGSVRDLDVTPKGKKGFPIKIDSSPVVCEPKAVSPGMAEAAGTRVMEDQTDNDAEISNTQSSFGGADLAWWGQAVEETRDAH